MSHAHGSRKSQTPSFFYACIWRITTLCTQQCIAKVKKPCGTDFFKLDSKIVVLNYYKIHTSKVDGVKLRGEDIKKHIQSEQPKAGEKKNNDHFLNKHMKRSVQLTQFSFVVVVLLAHTQ
jgi:hypothetical protein